MAEWGGYFIAWFARLGMGMLTLVWLMAALEEKDNK